MAPSISSSQSILENEWDRFHSLCFPSSHMANITVGDVPPEEMAEPPQTRDTQEIIEEDCSDTLATYHVWEGGHRFHGYNDGQYAFPNGEIEQDNENIHHDVAMILLQDKLFYSPVDQALINGGECLDLGAS
jgi:hypothetical protein